MTALPLATSKTRGKRTHVYTHKKEEHNFAHNIRMRCSLESGGPYLRSVGFVSPTGLRVQALHATGQIGRSTRTFVPGGARLDRTFLQGWARLTDTGSMP